MQIYKINVSLLTLFSLLTYIFCGRDLKGRAPAIMGVAWSFMHRTPSKVVTPNLSES